MFVFIQLYPFHPFPHVIFFHRQMGPYPSQVGSKNQLFDHFYMMNFDEKSLMKIFENAPFKKIMMRSSAMLATRSNVLSILPSHCGGCINFLLTDRAQTGCSEDKTKKKVYNTYSIYFKWLTWWCSSSHPNSDFPEMP